MSKKILFVMLAFIAFSASANAETIYPCDTSCTGKFSAANQYAIGQAEGTVFSVIDVKDWSVSTYRVEHVYMRGEFFERPKKIATSSQAQNAVNELQAKHAAVHSQKIYIPSEIADSAHEIVVSGQVANQVANYVATNLAWYDTLGALAGSILQIFNKIVDVNLYMEVEFSDGSTARYDLTGYAIDDDGDWVFEFTMQEGSAEDSDGNNIPTTEDEILGERRFPRELNQDLFRNVAEYYGARFDYGGCKSVNTTVCISSSNGYSCTTFTVCF